MAGTTDFTTWDFHNYHVQQELTGGQFVSAETTLIAAGPPELSDIGAGGAAGAGTVYPIGLLESVGLQQNKQLQRIFEIGSSRSYFVPGRNIGSLSIGRTFYFGPSLLRVLYAYYAQNAASSQTGADNFVLGGAAATAITEDGNTLTPNPYDVLLPGYGSGLHTVVRSPGEGYFWIDLASDIFAQPTGMAIYFKDSNDLSLGAVYLENCYVQGHQMNISSGSVLVMEGASMQYDQLRPIKVL
jgi:hypothetical protein